MNGDFTISGLMRKMLGMAIIFSLSLIIWGAPQPASGYDEAVLWENGTISDLGINGNAEAINNSGQVVGFYGNGDAFLWQNGTITDLRALGGNDAYDINSSGQIVEDYWNSTAGRLNAFFWQNSTITYPERSGENIAVLLALTIPDRSLDIALPPPEMVTLLFGKTAV